MSHYLSRLAARTGLLNQSQSATPGVAPALQAGHHALQQHLEIQNEYATIQAPVSAKPEIGSIRHASAPVEAPKPRFTSMHHEENTEPDLSGMTAEYSGKPNIQSSTEHHRTHSAERRMTVVAERLEHNPPEITSFIAEPIAEPKQADPGSQSVAMDSDLAVQVAQTNERLADDSANIDKSRLVLHHNELDTPATKTDNPSPPEDKRSKMSVRKTNQIEPLVADPLAHVLEFKPADNMTRIDSNQARQHGDSMSGQQFKQKTDNPSQINIQSITLEVHQTEPTRVAAPAPAPQIHAPAPKQNTPSQTRLSRYYLKGW